MLLSDPSLANGGRAWLLVRRDARCTLASLVDDRDQIAIRDFLFRIGSALLRSKFFYLTRYSSNASVKLL